MTRTEWEKPTAIMAEMVKIKSPETAAMSRYRRLSSVCGGGGGGGRPGSKFVRLVIDIPEPLSGESLLAWLLRVEASAIQSCQGYCVGLAEQQNHIVEPD